MEHLPGLAWIKDSEGRYVYANEAAFQTFRVTREELYGKTDEEVFPPETAAKFRENDRRALRGETGLQIVEALLHEDGIVHHSYVSKFPIPRKDGTSPLVGGIAIDITDQMRAEAALRQREEEAGRQKDAFLAALGHELRNPLAPMVTALQLLRLRGIEGREVEILEHQIGHMRRLVDDLLDVARITSGKIQLRMEEVDLASIVARAIDTVAPILEQHSQLLEVDGLAAVHGERHRIIANDWLAADMQALIARLLERVAEILDGVDFTPAALREDLAGPRRSPGLVHSAAELLNRAADLCSESAGLVNDNERRWRTFRAQVCEVIGTG